MPHFLKYRNADLVEWMDRPDCDKEMLFNTYKQFHRINRLLSGWKKIYTTELRPVIEKNNGKASVLDIGCGGGDVLRMLHKYSLDDGFNIQFTGIDPDKRSLEYLGSMEWPDNIQFEPLFSDQLVKDNREFDIVISNHVMHHLKKSDLSDLSSDAEKLARQLIIFSDIERSDIGYAMFSAIAPLLFRNSYIVRDGLISIKRSFRKDELSDLLTDRWVVQRQFPFRLLAIHRKNRISG